MIASGMKMHRTTIKTTGGAAESRGTEKQTLLYKTNVILSVKQGISRESKSWTKTISSMCNGGSECLSHTLGEPRFHGGPLATNLVESFCIGQNAIPDSVA